MANDDFELPSDDESDSGSNDGKGLRAQLQRALSENKALKEEIVPLRQAKRTSDAATVFKDAGVDPKYAKLYNSGEITAEAIKAWADEFGFAGTAPESDTPSDAGKPVDMSAADSAARMRAAQSDGLPPSTGDLLSQMGQLTAQELVAQGFIKLED